MVIVNHNLELERGNSSPTGKEEETEERKSEEEEESAQIRVRINPYLSMTEKPGRSK